MFNGIENRISEVEEKLTKSDKKLLEYIRRTDYNSIVYQSITEISEQAGIGEATILRFCRKIGLKGYQEFKLILAQELAMNTSAKDEGFIGVIAEEMGKAINETKNSIDQTAFNRAVDLLVNSNRKYFFGLGSSGVAAVEAKNRLIRIGFHVDALLDSHFMAMVASTLKENDVIVLLSISGSTKDIIEVAKIAKENKVELIVITSHPKSPVTKYADVILYTVQKEGPLEGGSLVSKISQLYIIEILCAGITLAINGNAVEMMEKTARAVVDKIV